jgi:hypothetical protein
MNVDEFHPSMIVKHYCTNEKSNKGKGHSHEYCIQAIQLYIELSHFKVKGFAIFFTSRGCVNFNLVCIQFTFALHAIHCLL